MKWLEEPQNEAERLLREGLDQATKRMGDEISHRRVWAQVADAVEAPQPRFFPGRFIFAGAASLLLVAAGVVAFPHVRRLLVGQATPSGLANKAAPSLPIAAPSLPDESADPNTGVEAQDEVIEAERVPGHHVSTGKGERARVALGGGAEAELAESSDITWDNQHRPSIVKGRAHLSVPHQPPGWRFSVTAGPYVVTVVGTKFDVQVASRMVGVDVTERWSKSGEVPTRPGWSLAILGTARSIPKKRSQPLPHRLRPRNRCLHLPAKQQSQLRAACKRRRLRSRPGTRAGRSRS